MRIPTFLYLVSPLLLAGTIWAQERAAFSRTPQELQQAFAGVEHGDDPVTVLLEEVRFDFDAQGRHTERRHVIFKVWKKEAAEGWGMLERSWAPWLEQKPELRARVIAPDGEVHELDSKTIAESPVDSSNDGTLSDRRVVRAPLPALGEGSVVEQEVVVRETALQLDAGTVRYFYFGNYVPVLRTRVEIAAPESLPLRYKLRLLPEVQPRDQRKSGIRTIVLEQGPMKKLEDAPPLLPPDEPRSPHVVFSTAPDWNRVASGYGALVDGQLKGFDATSFLPRFRSGLTREEKILAIVDKLNLEIRYTGIEFSEASVVPRKPSEVLERKYGDCKDKSTLAVAMLRAAGIPAHVALLYSSTGSDIEPDLPGMGVFNHAIVYVPGSPEFWLDPTDQDLRLDVVSAPNQGRYALIAAAGTKDLMRTPELTAEHNRIVETREFHLAEIGRAKVSEISETYGVFDREYRGAFGSLDSQKLRVTLKSYLDYTYGEAKFLRAGTGRQDDLTTPFRLTVELEDTQRGTSDRAEAAVGIFTSQIFNRLPQELREAVKKEEKEGEKPKPPRTQDFYLAQPFTNEWHYRIHMPPGFRVRQMPAAQKEQLGPASFRSAFRLDGDVLLGEFSFVAPKRRLTAAEGAALRDAAVEFSKRPVMLVFFDQIGEVALAAGRVREALQAFSDLRKLHPKEALHATQTARALLAAGGGSSARAEARQAVAMEPKSAEGFIQLAEILKNDMVGRPMAKGLDAAGAVEAYRKALEIKPSDDKTRANLAILLEHNADGVRYGPGARLVEARAEYEKMLDKLAGLGVPQNYPVLLFRMGKSLELRDYLKKQPDSEVNQALRICADAMLEGSQVAIRTAGELAGAGAKVQRLTTAGQSLIIAREYGLAADLLEAGAAGSANPAGVTGLVLTLRNTRKFNDEMLSIQKPADAIRVFLSRLLHLDQHREDWAEPVSPLLQSGQTEDTIKGFQRGVGAALSKLTTSGVGLEVGYDLLQSSAQFVEEGSDELGWVVRATFPGSNAGTTNQQTWFIAKEPAGYRILGLDGSYEGVGLHVLKLIAAGRLDQAKVWLDRVRQQLRAGDGDDPLGGAMFARVWQARLPAESGPMKVAAALLLTSQKTTAPVAIPILEEARSGASAAHTPAILAGLEEAYFMTEQYRKSLPIATSLATDLPQSPEALAIAIRATYAAEGRTAGAALLTERVKVFHDDVMALRSAARIAMLFGDTGSAISVERRIVDSGRGTSNDYNALAWLDLMAGQVTQATLDTANKGVMIGGAEATGLIHTTAAIAAELGKETEARGAILQRIKLLGSEEPDDDDWYVFGRIAEQYGLAADAAAYYRKLSKPGNDLMVPSSSYGLAQRRLKTMEARKK
ncbi:DUF3857 domain-containing protein [uncultured Paludibaculum sp.]|uniref:DUF3857 domain-containing protein n=1 Tax=uncultured Paludibaculum sp. TaxID=1765020 RepID=UPI002AAB224C|nr:DUF3857 domain-containing protein [uncultured Paludibaculum sp.]